MSALEDDRIVRDPEPGVFYFTQPIPVPAYLIALAAGELDFRDISRRVRIWAEPGVVEAAAEEFSETEDFLQAAEALTCPYLWTRYDVLTMPPSFPYGGMENPCLTFATPTLLAGDKSLADVIAHEIAHSWTGNLVTNATWEHFWLNEGWTVWLERRILAKVKGSEDYLKLSAQVGWNHLKDDISRMGHDGKFTRLVWPLAEEDPDEAFSRVPYEKGFNLLYHLEGLVGAERFLVFAKAYIQKFKLVCVTSGEFRDFFVDYFSHLDEGEEGDDGDTDEGDIDALNLTKPSKREAANGQNGKNAKNRAMLDGIDWDVLLLAPGMPAHQPDFSNALTITAHVLARRWVAVAVAMGAPSSSGRTEGRTDQIVVFSKEDMLVRVCVVWAVG
jgi:leukotriene-A4 hydrolase